MKEKENLTKQQRAQKNNKSLNNILLEFRTWAAGLFDISLC